MSDEKSLARALSIVQTLHKRTRQGKVNWEQKGVRDVDAFQADFGELGVIIRQIPDPDYPEQPDYWLTIINKLKNIVIETISNVTLRPVMDRTTEDGLNPYNALRDMFEMARRKALNVDEALDDLLQKLEGPNE